MGDVAEPFREVGSFHFDRGATIKGFHEVGDASFDVGVCKKASGEVGGFNFDMGGTDVSSAASYGVQAFFKLSDAAKALCTEGYGAFCDAGDDVEAFGKEDDGSKLDWVSPRISFSQDLTMEELCDVEASRNSRGFPEKRKWQEGESGELDEGCFSDFEFSNDDVVYGSFSHQTKDFMLSADELFLDGKLLPMHTQQTAPSSSAIYGDISICRSKLTLQESHVNRPNLQEAHRKSIDGKFLPLDTQQAASFPAASCSDMCIQKSKLSMQECNRPDMPDNHQKRHLSLDLPKPTTSSIVHELAPLVSLSVDNSPCSSPPRTSSPPSSSPVLSTTPVSHKAVSKYTFRIKELFKPKKVSSSVNAQLTRDNSTTSASTCRIPIPPRAFWPFSRSNSAGESKTTTPPPPTLPPRSNSAGESNTARVSPACKSSSEAQLREQFNTSSTSHAQDPMISGCEDAENLAKTLIDAGSLNQSAESSKQADNDEEESVQNTAGTSQDERRSNRSNKGRLSGSPGRASRRKYLYTTANFLRGSPGRRGGMNSLAKMNTSRIVLRNLERCSAERKLCQESSSRRATSAYPVALRVSPVINVAVYRGKMPSSGMFGLRSLFSSKKEKVKEKEAPVNNWRMGA